MQENKDENFSDNDFAKEMNDLWNNCESNKYLDKYGISQYDLGRSQSLKTFIVLIYKIEKDRSDKLKIDFNFYKNVSYGREYIRYVLKIKGTYEKDIFIQIPYNENNYKNGSMFTIANVYEELYENQSSYFSEIKSTFRELTEQAYQEFITNKK